jgi:large subunit ribosomal protein L19
MSAQDLLRTIDQQNRRQGGLPEFRAGDSVKVWAKIREGEKTRLQAFEGVCIRRVRKGARSTFTVRKVSYGVGVERIFPDNSPNIEKVEIVSRGKVHQSRLFYLRDLSGKAARIKERGQSQHQIAAAEAASDAAQQQAAADAEAGIVKEKIKGRGKRKAKKDARTASAS